MHVLIDTSLLSVFHSGDNPSCIEGPPVTIDWAHDPNTQFVLDINTFERMRGRRRAMNQLIISKISREKK